MNKELKFWIVLVLVFFIGLALFWAWQAIQTAEDWLQALRDAPGEILQAIVNAIWSVFGGSPAGSNVTDQVDSGDSSTLAEEGLPA